jgi:flagellar basal-body rod protein FlgB
MDFLSIPLFSTMKSKLGYHGSRQSVLAQNIANVDTPGYQARDIAKPDFSGMVSRAGGALPLATTHAGHMDGGAKNAQLFAASKRPSTYERNPNGNNVVIEEEMMRAAENQAEYQQVVSLYRKSVEMFRTALGRGGGGA